MSLEIHGHVFGNSWTPQFVKKSNPRECVEALGSNPFQKYCWYIPFVVESWEIYICWAWICWQLYTDFLRFSSPELF